MPDSVPLIDLIHVSFLIFRIISTLCIRIYVHRFSFKDTTSFCNPVVILNVILALFHLVETKATLSAVTVACCANIYTEDIPHIGLGFCHVLGE
jgi:hypothetical protein